MRVVQLESADAVEAIEAWGYYREIPVAERELSKFFSFGANCVWWVNKSVHCLDGELTIHICIAPGYRRGRLYGRKLVVAFEVVAELMLATALLVPLEPGSIVGNYLGRMGFSVLPERGTASLWMWSKDLSAGGEDHGWWRQQASEAETGS